MSQYHDVELLSRYVSLIAEATCEALTLSQTSLQLLIKHAVVSFEEATEMKRIVEANTKSIKMLRQAISIYDAKKAETEDFENLLKKMLNDNASMTDLERERLLRYLDGNKNP